MTRCPPRLRLSALALAAALPVSAAAQQPPQDPPVLEDPDSGLDRLPSVEELRDQAERALGYLSERIAPLLEDLEEGVEDLPAYGAPQVLPNGDILIPRRREEERPSPPPAPGMPPAERPDETPSDRDPPRITL